MSRTVKSLIGLAIVTLIACTVLAYFTAEKTQITLDNIHWTVTGAVSALLGWLGYKQANPNAKCYKVWFFYGLLSYFIGQLFWDWQVFSGQNTFPAKSDIFYVAMGVLISVGFVEALKTQLSGSKVFAAKIDALSFTTAILGFILVLYLPQSNDVSPQKLLALTAYPVSLLSAASISLILILYLRPKFMWPWVLMSAGLLIEGIIWMLWNLDSLRGFHASNSVLNKLFSVSDILLGLGAYGWHVNISKNKLYHWYCKRVRKLIPLIAFAVGISTVILIAMRSGAQPYAYYIAVSSIIAILIFSAIRQSILLNESERLSEAQHLIAQKEMQNQYLEQYDPLTNLPNRWLMQTKLQHALLNATREEATIAVMFIDVCRFKNVNDSFGHFVGDQFLVMVGEKLYHTTLGRGELGRMGSDKFALILNPNTSEQDIKNIAAEVMQAIHKPFEIGSREFLPEVNIGISMFPRDTQNLTDLARNANTALHNAKTFGGSQYRFYSPELTILAQQEFTLDKNLRKAIENQAFFLEFQPICELINGQAHIRTIEALVRWRMPDDTVVQPSEFIPYAEKVGLILPIGEWVIANACKTLAELNRQLAQPIGLSINISPKQFRQTNLPNLISQMLNTWEIDPKLITLEITESTVFDNENDAIETLLALKRIGVRLSLDDFGTGYSSLFQLRKLPIDEIKIDKAFLTSIPNNKADAEIVRNILDTAQTLALSLVVEGVENPAQLEFLHTIGCPSAQGYLFRKPTNINTIKTLLNLQSNSSHIGAHSLLSESP